MNHSHARRAPAAVPGSSNRWMAPGRTARSSGWVRRQGHPGFARVRGPDVAAHRGAPETSPWRPPDHDLEYSAATCVVAGAGVRASCADALGTVPSSLHETGDASAGRSVTEAARHARSAATPVRRHVFIANFRALRDDMEMSPPAPLSASTGFELRQEARATGRPFVALHGPPRGRARFPVRRPGRRRLRHERVCWPCLAPDRPGKAIGATPSPASTPTPQRPASSTRSQRYG